MPYKIQMRRGTAAEWTAANPTPSAGEICVEIDTLKVKVGNGTDAWADLAYLVGGGGGQTPWLTMTTTEMNAIASPTEGMAVWNTTEHQLMVYDGSGWVGVAMTL